MCRRTASNAEMDAGGRQSDQWDSIQCCSEVACTSLHIAGEDPRAWEMSVHDPSPCSCFPSLPTAGSGTFMAFSNHEIMPFDGSYETHDIFIFQKLIRLKTDVSRACHQQIRIVRRFAPHCFSQTLQGHTDFLVLLQAYGYDKVK